MKVGTTGNPTVNKGGTTAIFLKIPKVPHTFLNFLKIVEKHFFHQNNYF
jgi:hypothetical protein